MVRKERNVPILPFTLIVLFVPDELLLDSNAKKLLKVTINSMDIFLIIRYNRNSRIIRKNIMKEKRYIYER